MPWAAKDALKHKKGLSPSSQARWASVANDILKQTGDEAKAIKTANGVTREAVQRRLKKNRTGIGGF